MSTAIEFNHVGKQYRLGLVSTKTLSHDINRWWQTAILKKEDPYLKIGETNDRTTARSHSDYVWALRDIDFKVEQGDVVGIIGKNGAGKSTLLKLLSKVTGPTVGSIHARGRIGALLEVGTGFHPEMTGRENIYLNGAIMGMTKAEINRKLDDIVGFSGCERYIDTPVKRYSSGMMVRLGFAVAAHLEPEILVVDEVLAVGDAEFQKKAIGKMQEVSQGEGRTVLFVSHNMTAVKNLCHSCILLEKGCVNAIGDTNTIITKYLSDNTSVFGYDLTTYQGFSGTGELRIGSVEIFSEGYKNGVVVNNIPVLFRVEILNPERIQGVLEIAGVVRNLEHTYVTYFGNRLTRQQFKIPDTDSFIIEGHFDSLPYTPQSYLLGIELLVDKRCVWWKDEVIRFQVSEVDFYGSGDSWTKGLVLLKQNWEIK